MTSYPSFVSTMNTIGRERGWSPMARREFEAMRSPRGALLIGDAEEVVEKILFEHSIFGMQRFLIQLTVGAIPHLDVMHAIELLGTKVAPVVRSATAREVPTADAIAH